MPNDFGHSRITMATAAASTPIAVYFGAGLSDCAALAGSILFSGFLFSCDLDTDSAPYRRWGPLKYAWWPYKELIAHRAPWSHWPVLGTVCRLLYVATVALICTMISGVAWDIAQQQPIDFLGYLETYEMGLDWLASLVTVEQMRAILIGLEVGSLVHIIPDHLVTFWRKRT